MDSTPTPTPTPTPVAYDTLEQTLAKPGDKSFQTAGIRWTGFGNKPETDVAQFGPGSELTIQFLSASNAYRLTPKGGTAVDFAVSRSTTVDEKQYFDGSTSDQALGLIFTTPAVGKVPLSYTRLAEFTRTDYATQAFALYTVVWGVPTAPGDLPKSGSAKYDLSIIGAGFDPDVIYGLDEYSTGTLSANFGNATVAMDLRLVGDGGDDGPVPLSNLTGAGTIASSGFSGTLTGSDGKGWFAGGFFGPQAAETGLSLQYDGTGFDAQAFAFGVKK